MEEDPFAIEEGNGNEDDDDEDDDDINEKLEYYKGEMEEALTWILEAEEHLIDIDLMEKNLPEVREIFKKHEEFINLLKDIQIEVGKLLADGQDIVDSEDCPPEERTELELQMNLLNERLEQLSLKALEFRKNIHETLMILQQKQINHLRNWLFSAEDKLSHFTDFGSDLIELKKQLTDYQNFQQDVNVQEEIVDSLRNLVWIYDDCEGSSSPTLDKPPDELQDQLAPLAEKWNMVCQFIRERKKLLEEIVQSWENFTDGESKFNSWRVKVDRRLREMEEAAADMHIGSSFVGELVKRLEKMEAEMDLQRTFYVEIGEKANQLIDRVGSESAAGSVITRKMETLKEVWDATVQRMGTLSHVVSKINEASLAELSTDDIGEESMTEGNEKQVQVEGKPSHHPQHQQQKQQPQQQQQQKATTPTITNQLVSSSAKKRRLDSWLIQEWQKALDVFTTWLTGVEEVIGVEESVKENCSTSWNSMPLEEQQIFLEDTESELEVRKQEFDSLVNRGSEFLNELTKYDESYEEATSIKEIVDKVNERWCQVNLTLRERKLRHHGLVKLNQMVGETDAMSRVLESAKKFLQTTNCSSDLSSDVLKKVDENCKLRIKVLSSKEDKVSKLRKELEDLKSTLPTATKEPSYQTIVSFFTFWEEVNGQLSDLNKKVSESLNEISISTKLSLDKKKSQQQPKQQSSENEQSSDLYDKVNSFYDRLIRLKENKLPTKPKVYFDSLLNAAQLDEYNHLLGEIDNEGKHLKTLQEEVSSLSSCKEKNFINHPKQQQGQTDNTWVKEMRDKCNSSQEIWDFCHNECLNRIANLGKLESSLTAFEEETSILESEVEQLNDFLDELRPALGDVQTLESDVEQCNKVLNEIEATLESNCALIISKSEQLIAEFDYDDDSVNGNNFDGGSKCLQDRMDRLKEKCSLLGMKAFDKRQELETVLVQSKNVCQSFEKLERDIESLSFEADEVRHSVVDDYKKSFTSCRALQERLRKTNEEANKLTRLLNNLSPSHQPTTESLEEMKSKTETIKETLKSLIESIDEYQITLKQSHLKFGEFTRLIMMEKDWLDKLDRKLKRSPQTAADAEEISGNLDDLETYLRHRPVSRSDRIHKLANELISVGLFSDSVEIEINKVDQRWKSLQHQAQQRLQDLEASITDAQQCDSQILKVQKWIQDVDCLLDQRLDDDILAEDMPDEVEKLDAEFKSSKKILDLLTGSIENYRSQERLEAASRLEEQLAILNAQFEELVIKFKKYQHPTDYETRLNKLSKTLNELMDSLIDLKVTSYEYSVIQGEFNECRKLIKEIENVQEEIDKVKKQTSLAIDLADDPDDLMREVNELETIYDNLTRMANERKEEIGKMMETSSTVMNLLYDLKNWLNQQEDPSSVDPNEFGQKKENLRQLTDKVQLLLNLIDNKDDDDKLRLNIETIVSDFELLEEKMSRKESSRDLTDGQDLTAKQSASLKSLSKQRQLGLQRSIDLSEGIDSNHSSPKSTTSRKGSLSRTIAATAASEGLPILTSTRTPESSNTIKLLNFCTLHELEDIDRGLQNIQIYLNTSEVLNKGDGIERNKQEAFKQIRKTMESQKPKIHQIVSEKTMINTIHPQGPEYVPLIESIWGHWQELRKSFMKRHRRFWFARKTKLQYETARDQINEFIKKAEESLAASRLPTGELNIEVAKEEYEPLRTAFNEHVPVFGTFKVMTRKYLADLPDGGDSLKDYLNVIDEKWILIVRDLAWRKERLHNEDKNMYILGYWNQLEAWIGKVNTTLAKLDGKIESFEMANILQNEVKFLEQELQTQWLNMMTIQLAPTMIIEKDVDTMERDFFKLIIELPKARIDIDEYLTSFKLVTRMLDSEIDWTSSRIEEEIDFKSKPIEDASTHETNFEQLAVMLQEIENYANKFGHKPPSFLKEKMDCLKEKRELLQKKMRLNEPSSSEWYNWLDLQVDYIAITFRDCTDEKVLDQLKNIVDQIEKQISIHEDQSAISHSESNDNKAHDVLEDDQSAELETMNKNISSYRWNSLKEKTLALQIRLEANSGDELNQLLLSLRELYEWVIKKRSEYSSLGDIEGDVTSLTKQQEDLTNLRLSLEEEKPIIETTLMSGRSQLSKGDSQGYDDNTHGGSRNLGVNEVKRVTQSIQWEVDRLSEKWSELLRVIDHRQRRLDDIMRKMLRLQAQMDELAANLCIADMTRNKWIPISEIAVDQLSDALNELQSFRDNVYPLQRFVDQMNGSATRISGSQVLLSNVVLNRLEELNTRWKLIQVSIEERRKNLEQAVIDHNSAQQRFLNDGVEHPWERAVAFNKVPYYINHETETTHWDHPKMTELINTLNEFNEVRYSAYRTAMKLRSVQRHLCLDLIHLDALIKIFYDCGLAGQNDKLLNVPEIIAVLQTIYEETASGDQAIVINVPLSIDLCLNWLLNLYDTANRTGFIRALSLKIGLVTLCKGILEEKYRYMFRLIADTNGLADERSLAPLLHDFIQVPRLLGEVVAFGGNSVEPSIRSCFDLAGSKTEIELFDFLAWLQREPQSTVWLPVLHRLAAAEKAKHQSKCNVCKQFPIIGFRYKCLLCFNFDMCQICFFSGRVTKNHKIIHPMQEYCLTTSSGQDIKDFTRIIRNKFKSKRYFKRHPKYGYLPVQTVENDVDTNVAESNLNSPTHTLQHPDSLDMHSKLEIYASRLAEVELDNGQDRNFDNYEELSDDDHQSNAQYRKDYDINSLSIPHGQLITSIAPDQRNELESIINGLEQENRQLQAEYERLKIKKSQQVNGKGSTNVQSDSHLYSTIGSLTRGGDILTVKAEVDPYASLISSRDEIISAEAKALRTKEDELEAKRILLEEQNKRLEATLKRLRHFLSKFPDAQSLTNTLRSTHSDYTNPTKLLSSTGRLNYSTNNSMASLRINGSSDSHHHLNHHQSSTIANHSDEATNR